MQRIKQFEPQFSKEDSQAVARVVESGWTSEGKLTKAFEEKVARIMGYRFGVACCNGTVALSLAMLAMKWEANERALIPDFTFIGTANAAAMIGASIKFEDVDERTFNAEFIDVSVALNGRRAGTFTIVDAAQALGSKIGNLATYATLSFAPNKLITTAQGGMVLTNYKNNMEKIRRLKDHGRLDKKDFHPQIGFDFKFSDLQAALGLSQLERLPQRIAHKRRICAIYQEELKNVKDLTVCGASKGELLWCQDVLTKHRDLLQARLLKAGIETRAFYKPLHTQPAFRTEGSFPVATKISSMGLWLPSGPGLTETEVLTVCGAIKRALK